MNPRHRLRPLARCLRLAAHIAGGMGIALLCRLRYGAYWYRTGVGSLRIRDWMRKTCDIVGLQVRVRGAPAGSPALLAANHVSWLDIVALNAICPMQFVAKAEVRRWPWLGALAAVAGTLFLSRKSGPALDRTLKGMAMHLYAGRRVVVFPEGTTSCGDQVLRFRPALFEAAVRCRTPVQPVAIRYLEDGRTDRLAPFVGDDDFASHLWRLVTRGGTEVHIHFLPPLQAGAGGRRLLAMRSHEAVVRSLYKKAELERAA